MNIEGPKAARIGMAQIVRDQLHQVRVNDRKNWRRVASCLDARSAEAQWFTNVYKHREMELWSKYATDLYLRIRTHAERHRWLHILRYLLYEGQITGPDAERFGHLEGVLLQSKPDEAGRSKNPAFANR